MYTIYNNLSSICGVDKMLTILFIKALVNMIIKEVAEDLRRALNMSRPLAISNMQTITFSTPYLDVLFSLGIVAPYLKLSKA